MRVVLLAGMGGGTGSGMAIDLANLARSCIQRNGGRIGGLIELLQQKLAAPPR